MLARACGDMHAGFLLQEPAIVFVGGTQVNITVHERTSISYTYPTLAPGNYNITVQRGQTTSNAIQITIAAAASGVTSGQGGPFADTPKYKQTSVPFDAVRPTLSSSWGSLAPPGV